MNFIKIKFVIVLIFVVSLLSTPYFVSSEIKIYDTDIDIQTWPENPEPYQDVNIKLVSYATDLTKANIVWKVGSKILLSGYGKTSYSFTAPGPDVLTNIIISITPANSLDKITKEIFFKPSEVELLWEATNAYTPPFYKGKALVSPEGTIKVVAIPNSSSIKYGKGNISYKWKRRDETNLNVSGYNKDSYLFENNPLNKTEDVSVSVSSIDGSYNATKSLEVPTYSPEVLFYKKSPTEGILYNKTIDNNYVMSEDEMTIVAAPYNLAIKGSESIFDYKWKINGDPIKTPTNKTELTIRPVSRGGYADISIVFENTNKLFQIITGKLKITL